MTKVESLALWWIDLKIVTIFVCQNLTNWAHFGKLLKLISFFQGFKPRSRTLPIRGTGTSLAEKIKKKIM